MGTPGGGGPGVGLDIDRCISYSTYYPIFKSQKGSIEALNFYYNYLIDYLINYIVNYTIGFIITTEK